MAEINMMQEALNYAAMGLAVFPVDPRTKHPKTPHGCLDAKKEPGPIKNWWRKWKDAAIGIATGSISGGLVVVDLDRDEEKGKDGYLELKKWEEEHGKFPETWQSITGRGGYHIFFRAAKQYSNREGVLDGVDVRGEGGYVIAPPSLHPNGRRYEWEYGPEDLPLAQVTESVEALLLYGRPKDGEEAQRFELPETIPSGERNGTLFKYACSLQARNVPNDAIVDYVKLANKMRCDEPLEDDELQTLIESALRYEKGTGLDVPSFSGWHEPDIKKKEVLRNGKSVMVPVQSIENAIQAITYDRELFQKIRMNDLKCSPYVCGKLPWDAVSAIREWNNEDDACLLSYLEKNYDLKTKEMILTAFMNVTHYHRFHPVREFLEQMHRDYINAGSPEGKIRMLLPYYLGAEDTEYTYAVMRMVMLGAVSRAFHPGVKFDYVMILSGDQGVGKSFFLRYLAMNDDWFSDNFNTLETDKAAEKLQGKWILEMAELLAAKRTKEVEGIKAFLTSTADVYRPPYNRRVENRPRQCVFVGTTNESHFLTDRTGNRRFLPVQVRKEHAHFTKLSKEEIQKEMRLAWGEVMDIFEKADRAPLLVLDAQMAEAAQQMQERFTEEDPNVGIIQEWLDANKGGAKGDRTCAIELWREALGNDGKHTNAEINAIRDIMLTKIHGWIEKEGKSRCGKYGVQRCFEKIEKNDFAKIDEGDDEVPFK